MCRLTVSFHIPTTVMVKKIKDFGFLIQKLIFNLYNLINLYITLNNPKKICKSKINLKPKNLQNSNISF
jgi:hypothetical protein